MTLHLKRLPAPLWAILGLALTLRLAGAVWWQARLGPGQRFEFGDSEAYWVLAQHIARGEPFEYGSPDARIFRMPGYPALLAVLFYLFGPDPPVVAARLLSGLLGTLAVAAVYWLAATLFDRRTGLLAALAAACYPGAISMGLFVLSEAPFCTLYVAQLAAWIKSWQAGRYPFLWATLSGLLGGLAALVRPDWLLFVPFAALAGLFFAGPRMRHLQLSVVMMLVVAAVMAPWWWRNSRVVGHFVPTTLQIGASLYDGLNPKATGASEMSFVNGFVQQEQKEPSLSDEPFEYRLDRRMRNAAVEWAAAHPAQVIKLAAVKFIRMWNVRPNDPQSWGSLGLVTAVTFVPAIATALAGIGITRRPTWPAALCWLPAVYLTLLHLIFVSSIRYREPPMLGLLVFTAAFFTRGSRPSPAR